MSVTKRSISLNDNLASQVEQAAQDDGVSFSAWLNEAAKRRLILRQGLQGVREWEADAGELTAEERAAGEALLDRLLKSAVEGAA